MCGEWLSIKEEGFVLSVYVQPGAKSTQVSGLHDGVPKIRLAAPPVEGKANTALIGYLAKIFCCPKRAVTLVSGETSRHKIIRIEQSLPEEEICRLLGIVV